MEFIKHSLLVRNGGRIVIRELRGRPNTYLCPICGVVLLGDEPPWRNDKMLGLPAKSPDYASGCQDICPCCGVQYGNEGTLASPGGMSIEQLWMKWRLRWLKEREWDEKAIAQLQNLEYSREDILKWKM